MCVLTGWVNELEFHSGLGSGFTNYRQFHPEQKGIRIFLKRPENSIITINAIMVEGEVACLESRQVRLDQSYQLVYIISQSWLDSDVLVSTGGPTIFTADRTAEENACFGFFIDLNA